MNAAHFANVAIHAARLRRFASQADDLRLSDGEKADLARARSLLALAGNERPRWADVPRQIAAIDELEDDYGAAIGHLRQACEFAETLPFGRRRLAYLLILTGRAEEARPVLQSLGPAAGIQLERLRAEKVAEAGRFDDALRLAAALTPDDCGDAEQLMWYASLLTRCRKGPEAVKACRRAIDLTPAVAVPWMTLIGIHLAGGDDAAAREVAAEARQRLDGEERTRFDAIVTDRLDDPEEVEVRYRRAVEADPADMEKGKKLVAALLGRKKIAEAREELRRRDADRAAVGETRGRGPAMNRVCGDPMRAVMPQSTIEKQVTVHGQQVTATIQTGAWRSQHAGEERQPTVKASAGFEGRGGTANVMVLVPGDDDAAVGAAVALIETVR